MKWLFENLKLVLKLTPPEQDQVLLEKEFGIQRVRTQDEISLEVRTRYLWMKV